MYKFRDGFHAPSGLSAEQAYAELERIRQKHGALLGDLIVEESRPSKAPLHDVFEWDDNTAAHQYRLQQARGLVRAIVVVDRSQPEHVYANVTIVEKGSREYVPVSLLSERADLLEDARKKAVAAVSSAIAWLEQLERLEKESGNTNKKTASAKRHLMRAHGAIV